MVAVLEVVQGREVLRGLRLEKGERERMSRIQVAAVGVVVFIVAARVCPL